MEKGTEKEKLQGPWREIQGAIWLIGIAILFWQGWWWPGILVLIAISGIFEAIVRLVVKPADLETPTIPADVRQPEPFRAPVMPAKLPARCPVCGAPASESTAIWSADKQHASCPYCNSNLVAE
jgi:hypothetical protein